MLVPHMALVFSGWEVNTFEKSNRTSRDLTRRSSR